MPDSSFTFTGQVRPVCELGLSDVRQPEPDEWVDISCYVHECELFRGRDRFTDRFQPGTATVTFKNTDGWADLVGSPSVVATQTLRPGRPIRVGVTGTWQAGVGVRWLWRGWIDQTTPQYHPVEHDVVVVNCVDALGEAGSAPAPASFYQGVNEGAGVRIHRVLDAVEWFTAKRKIDNSLTGVQGTSLGALAIDMMGQAADSAGGVVHGDLDGDVVFRDINWMLYDPDIPPDGIIGNVNPGFVIPYVPGYLNPEKGYVYWPDPPILELPFTLKVCAEGGDGTLIEQGDGYELLVRDGRLIFRSGRREWDMGPYDGGCTGVIIEDVEIPPQRIDDADEDDIWDIYDDVIVELAPLVLEVELVGWSQGCVGDDITENAVDVAITPPGPDCLLLALAIAQPSVGNAGHYLLQGAAEGASFPPTGGGIDWTVVHEADASVNPALATWIHATEIREDLGAFTLHYDWISTHTSRIHAVAVYRIRNASRDCIDRILTDPTLAAHDWIRGTPGDGTRELTVAVEDVAVEAIPDDAAMIVFSLADESVGPYGAVYDISAGGTWTFPLGPSAAPPVVAALIGGTGGISIYRDEFTRADTATELGTPWLTEATHLPTTTGTNPFVIHDEAAEMIQSLSFSASQQYVDDPTVPGSAQYAEVEVTSFLDPGLPGRAVGAGVVTRVTPGGAYRGVVGFIYADGSGVSGQIQAGTPSGFESNSSGFLDPALVAEPFVVRLESIGYTHTLYLNGAAVVTHDATIDGDHCGMFAHWSNPGDAAGGVSPRLDNFDMGIPGVDKCVSWETAWRVGLTDPTVVITDINLGDEDIQSAAMAVVVEGPVDAFNLDDDGALAVGGQSNAYSGFIYSAGAWEGVDPNDPDAIPIWTFDPSSPVDLGDLG